MMKNKSKHTSSSKLLMFSRLRLNVPTLWVLALSLTLALASTSLDSFAQQLWLSDPGIIHKEVNQSVNFDAHENSVDQCTHKEESCELNQMMSYLSKDQKQLLNSLYKIGQKCVTSESHVDFLSRSLEEEFIPKRFKLILLCVLFRFILVQKTCNLWVQVCGKLELMMVSKSNRN